MIGRLSNNRLIIMRLIIMSALMLAGAFWWPTYLWWGVFLFLIPIFYCVLRYPHAIGLWQGLLWGEVFYLVHGYGLVQLFYEHAHGWARVGVALVILMYCGMYAGAWFCLARLCGKVSSRVMNAVWWRMVCWVLVTIFYFIWMERCAWFLAGRWMGYCFASPLIPLAEYKQFLALSSVISAQGLLVLLVGGAAACACALYYKQVYYLIVVAVCWLPFAVGWLVTTDLQTPNYLERVCYVAPPCGDSGHPMDCAQAITYTLAKCIEQHPHVRCIVMPESTFPFALNEHPEIVRMWQENVPLDNAIVLFGAHRSQDNCCYNSLLCLAASRLSVAYDKTLLMPFTEYLPPAFEQSAVIQGLFLHKKQTFAAANEYMHPTKNFIIDNVCYTPRICAELYLDAAFVPTPGLPVMCMVNDSWFSASYMRRLMFLFARYKALLWGHELLYISHYQGVWVGPDGTVQELKR